jgi:FlaA1/EpsC-like NDP-sugar epimerase
MRLIRRFNHYLLDMPRGIKHGVLLLADLCVLPLLLLAAYTLRLSHFPRPPFDYRELLLSALVPIVTLYFVGFYRTVIRYSDNRMVRDACIGMLLAVFILYTQAYLNEFHDTPRSIFIIFGGLATLYLIGSRLVAGAFLRWSKNAGSDQRVVAIFGAGSAGLQSFMSLNVSQQYQPVVFIDDAASLQGQLVHGLPVLSRKRFPDWLKKHPEVKAVLLAIPSISEDQRRDVLQYLQTLGLPIKTLPSLPDLLSGKAQLSDIRDLKVTDLLSRSPIKAQQELMAEAITGKTVLVTGAGGSIGAELCRQIIRLNPSCLIMIDNSEYALYRIDQELRQGSDEQDTEIVPILASVLDWATISRIFTRYLPQTIFHAAAYKHVPLVESNVVAGVRNNTLGTWMVAEQAKATKAERFILVSTDKAVRPTNVMGASKRMAELVLQGMSSRGSDTIFSMVRFGNVLDSSGSVVPHFRKQIAAGGPVTVTHPDITRYFMTIPEAAGLVMQAGVMARGGEVYLLEMGEPVKIDNLARTMIQLMGRTVRDTDGNGDIAIEYVGLRPGEKLYEELLIDADAVSTMHPKIFAAQETYLEWNVLETELQHLAMACDDMSVADIRLILQRCVSGYAPDARQVDPFS